MPASITHAAKDIYDILPDKIKDKCDVKRIKMFGQSVDSLMFYNLFSILPGKKIRNFHSYFHQNKTQSFFINLLNYVKSNQLNNDVDVSSFIVGFICHYILDSTIHPYIIYKSGVFDKKNHLTFKYNNIHAIMETFLDNDMILRRNKTNPYNFPLNKFCFDLRTFSNDLNKTIDYTFYKTFKIKNMSKIYFKSLKQMRYSLILFRKDRFGIKKFFYKLIDTFTMKNTFRFDAISYHFPIEDRHNFLNSTHQLWRNPAIYDMTSTESFIDLYLKAIKMAKVIVCASFDFLEGRDIDLEKIFINTNYLTGLNCELKKELKYFEF